MAPQGYAGCSLEKQRINGTAGRGNRVGSSRVYVSRPNRINNSLTQLCPDLVSDHHHPIHDLWLTAFYIRLVLSTISIVNNSRSRAHIYTMSGAQDTSGSFFASGSSPTVVLAFVAIGFFAATMVRGLDSYFLSVYLLMYQSRLYFSIVVGNFAVKVL